jgi:PAS domain S-box-containing protein
MNRVILEASNALVFMIDPGGKILVTNEVAAKRFSKNKSELLGMSIYDIIPPELLAFRKAEVELVFRTGKSIIFEDQRQGTWYENNLFPVFGSRGDVERVVIFAYNITERRRSEIALRESEERYRTLAETAPDLIFIIGSDNCVQYVNSFAAAFIGLPPEELIGQPQERFFPPSTGDHQGKDILKVLVNGKMTYVEDELTIRDRTVWLSTWLVPLQDHSGKISGVLGVSRDTTGQKQAEAAILQFRDQLEERVKERTADLLASQSQLRQLTNQIVTAQEEERHRISRELHDDAGQALISLKYSLASMFNELPDSQSLIRQRLSDLMGIIDQIMSRIRTMAHSLRLPELDVGGTNLSLKDYCQEFMERTQLQIDYRGQDLPGLPDEISISLYRFVQEALTNVLKYAQATEAKVRLKHRNQQISLSVSDNGLGISDPQSDGIGLLGIQERLDLLGGTLQIRSPKGRGAKLTACVPWSGIGKE